MNAVTTGTDQAEREAFYARIDPQNMAPLWTRLKSLVPAAPTPIGVPHQWRYADVRPFVLESAWHISAEEAERRVLILENPGLRGHSSITQSLYAGLQLILPGEIAPSHRLPHKASDQANRAVQLDEQSRKFGQTEPGQTLFRAGAANSARCPLRVLVV